MKLSEYIKDLLYRYECVIVPGFGGFVATYKSASIATHTFRPPYKQLSFNSYLVNNDGLLANHIASVDKVPFESAMNFIKFEVGQWKEHLINSKLVLDDIGTFSDENNKLLFNPHKQINYLTESYGLDSMVIQEIKRETYKKQVEKLEEKAPLLITKEEPKEKNRTNYLKYAAAFVLGASLIAFGGAKIYQHNKEVAVTKEQLKNVDQNIQKATFVIDDPLPSIIIDATFKTKPYHVIAGAFRVPENADKMVAILKRKGFKNARILGVNNWGLTQVSFDSYTNAQEAKEQLYKLKNSTDSSAWLLVEDL